MLLDDNGYRANGRAVRCFKHFYQKTINLESRFFVFIDKNNQNTILLFVDTGYQLLELKVIVTFKASTFPQAVGIP